MPDRTIVKWTTLAIASFLIVMLFLGIVHRDTASAASPKPKQQTQGSLQVLDKDGNPTGECPLKHTEVKAQVSGFLSRVTVMQDFENPFQEKIEAVYKFPLPEAAAVDDLTMVIGERVVKGKIMRFEEAKAAYDTAKQTGKIASLLNQEQANVFIQQVANILPGQQIRIVISYVETLQYQDGSYEWSFPMVAAERYTPRGNDSPITDQQLNHANLSHASALTGMRAGHDISLEIDLDAGVPIVAVNSETHETEVQQIDERHTVVRLKDRATIPNKDFVLTYRVAGDSINDAVLAHRSERGGFFTLILQPPQRVSPEDVMPKELVFVLDTSGSMAGFPLDKAKETMDLALSTLYPHDTFNLITFAGDTEILFPEPMPATPENLSKARKFLKSRAGNGGTEMMKAIKAALDPSDSQYHVRIACFLTDGQVNNEAEIISEVQKHPNARVFAMGFGPAPNRLLLDKMSQYGRGEVNYVLEAGDTSSVARNFNARVRNPLLTDISIDWGNLSVTDVYPKRIPDLFSARPLIVSGRYTQGGKGTIRLKGKMAGEDFVREIQVNLPETETDHDVLSTLWARRRIEDLVNDQSAAVQDQSKQDEIREEIIKLGVDYKLMTQYTSFVAVDEVMFTGGEGPTRVDVPTYPGSMPSSVSGYVTITGGGTACVLYCVGTSVTTVRTIQELPVQGRAFSHLLTLTPGVVEADRQPALQGAYSVNGQRATSNSFTLDGVSTNFGTSPGGEAPGSAAAGNKPALTASGGTNGIAPLEAVQEMNIHTLAKQPEYGRVGGAHIDLISSSGTNAFHGSVFHFFGNDAFDASDWFANSRNLEQPPKRLNLFGASFGGPIRKDQSFFFGNYEGMRLRQPMVGITDVPSLSSRSAVPGELQPFFNAFPTPNGASRADGFAEFAASFANPARHDVGGVRIDHMLSANSMLRGRYSFADSEASQRGANGSSLNTTNLIRSRAQTITGALTQTLSPTLVLELMANYSRLRASSSYALDGFGGAATLPDTSSLNFDLKARNAALIRGNEATSVQRQFNLVGSATLVSGNHTFKFGGDYRRLSPIIGQRTLEENVLFEGIDQALTGIPARDTQIIRAATQNPVFTNLSLFAQDEWRQTPRLTLNYGVRWELAPAPKSNSLEPLTSFWKTTYANFAPRAGFAYYINDEDELVLRGGVGIAYDLGQDRSGDVFADSIPFISGSPNLPFITFDPRLKLPYAINWNLSLQRKLGSNQMLSAAYVGSSGKRLLRTQTLFDQNPEFPFLRLVTNSGSSDYDALHLKFERRFVDGLAMQVSYVWGRSLDNVSDDSTRRIIMASLNPALDRGPSDFDIEHHLNGYISYELPTPLSHGLGNKLFRNWNLDSIFNARSARPLNVLYMIPTSIGVAYFRPDVVEGSSLYLTDLTAPGGRRLNPAAFVIPANGQQGNLARNSQRGFPFYQIDLGLRRRFNFSEAVALQIQTDAFNVLNHTNFEDPIGNDLVTGGSLAFGQSTSLSGRSLAGGGFGSFYSFGGARTMRFSVKLLF